MDNIYSREIEPYLQGITCKKICWLIYENPGITNKEIYEELGLARSTISTHVQKLKKYGCLVAEPNGKFTNYFLDEDFHPDMVPYFEEMA